MNVKDKINSAGTRLARAYHVMAEHQRQAETARALAVRNALDELQGKVTQAQPQVAHGKRESAFRQYDRHVMVCASWMPGGVIVHIERQGQPNSAPRIFETEQDAVNWMKNLQAFRGGHLDEVEPVFRVQVLTSNDAIPANRGSGTRVFHLVRYEKEVFNDLSTFVLKG